MAEQPITAPAANESLQSTRVYAMALICLLVGLAIGYLLRESKPPAPTSQPTAEVHLPTHPAGVMGAGHMPSMAEMNHMADKQAEPLLQKLKSDPNNSTLLVEIGAVYHAAHQFSQAAAYYGKAAQLDPGNVATRIKLASSLYRNGDIDGAITQLNRALSYDPKDANALFDLGMIRWQGKGDVKGALAAWQQLLKTNPQLSADRKATVEKLIAGLKAAPGDQRGTGGAPSDAGHKSSSN
ncbi:MAG: tetratricopeptide repeat protein [Terracidiphilus sp.]|jgi:cytochrome c-type biogenesis protein CcmH/NrfG